MNKNVYFYQLFEGETSTYTYLLADAQTKEAVLIDSVLETVDRDIQLLNELGLKLSYVLDTHVHADHITGSGELRKLTGCQTGISEVAQVECVDIALKDGQKLKLGSMQIECIATPGHTNGCMSFYCDGRLFTGDSLMIRSAGRTDFQQGSSEKLYDSIQRLFQLPDETIVYPAHDYRGMTSSSIGLEKKFNTRAGGNKTKSDFIKIMSELKLSEPKKIHVAVPANLVCGQAGDSLVFHPQNVNGILEVTPEDVMTHQKQWHKIMLVDVRRPDEFDGEYGHIPGAKRVTLGPDLMRFLQTAPRDQEILFICRSGGRSGQATAMAQQFGLRHAINMMGGMIRWTELRYPVERNGSAQ